MFEMIAGSAFPLPNQRLSLLLGRRSLSQGRTQDTGNASTLFKAVPFGSALFLTWWELGASRGCPHSIQSSLDSSCQPWL